jgi:hypothetical protein
MLQELFRFPIVMIDGDNEDRKQADQQRLGLPTVEEEEDYDMVFGEAEYPYWDFIGLEDRWLPSKESLDKALAGDFDACIVRFMNVGQLLVPWSKKKFKEKLLKFTLEYEQTNPKGEKKDVKILTITPDQYDKIVGEGDS